MAEKPSDFNMPEKIVTKLLRDSLPDNINISKDAKSAAARGASIFILQLVIAANEHAQRADVGLGEYAPILVRFNAQQKRDAKRRESYMLKSKAEKEAETNSQYKVNDTHDFIDETYSGDLNMDQT